MANKKWMEREYGKEVDVTITSFPEIHISSGHTLIDGKKVHPYTIMVDLDGEAVDLQELEMAYQQRMC